MAQAIAGEHLDALERFGALLAEHGPIRGLIGPREVDRLWERHLLNCAVLSDVVPDGVRVADVGSGAGLPGLVLALIRPDVSVTLIEPMLRRTIWLTEATEALGLSNVEVVRGRAESVPRRRSFDLVTARAVAALDQLITWCWPLVTPGGSMVALKGSRAHEEVEAALPLLHRRRLNATIRELETTLPEPTFAVVVRGS